LRPFGDIEVVGLGQACVDYLGRVPSYPREDGKVELLDLQSQCGGPTSTALVTLSRLGIKTSFLGSISDDPIGVEVLKALKADQVDYSFLKITPGHTSQFAFIAVSRESGNRTIFWHRGSVPHLKKGEVDLSPFFRARVLHLDGLMIEASMEAARQAKAGGLKVVLDAGSMRDGSLELVSQIDVLIASSRFAAPPGRESPGSVVQFRSTGDSDHSRLQGQRGMEQRRARRAGRFSGGGCGHDRRRGCLPRSVHIRSASGLGHEKMHAVCLCHICTQMQSHRRTSRNPNPPASHTILGNPPWNMIGGDVMTRSENPKHETRNPKQIQNPNFPMFETKAQYPSVVLVI